MRILSFKIFIVVASLFVLVSAATGQLDQIRFDRISIDQGLSQSTARCILQDSQGFMWIGTGDGLNKYDGYKFTHYKRDPEDPNSLSHNMIWALCEDRFGDIWIGTDMGLNRFDFKRAKFTRYIFDPDDSTSVSNNSVRAIYEDSAGNLWIGTNDGLNLYDRKRDTFTRFISNPGDSASLSHSSVRSIFEASDSTLWIGTYDGFNRLVRTENKFVQYRPTPNDTTDTSLNRIRTMVEDHAGTLWIATNNGLYSFDKTTGKMVDFQARGKKLVGNSVRALLVDSAGRLWIGATTGINIFNPQNETLIQCQNDPTAPNSLSTNEIRSFYEDTSGIIWVGTYYGGINKYDSKTIKFKHFHKDNIYPASLNHNLIRSFYEDSLGSIWIGTNGGGVNQFDRALRKYSYLKNIPGTHNSLSNNRVFAIMEDKEGYLWFGTNGGGVDKFNRETGKFIHYEHDPANPSSISNNLVRTIFQDHNGDIWIGTFGGGLNKFNPGTQSFTRYINDPANPGSISNDVVYTIYEDSHHNFWVGTRHGLNLFNREDTVFIRYVAQFGDTTSLSDKSVLCILEDRKGVIWIGTYGGLNKFDQQNQKFSHYTEKDGLPNNVIYGILEDDFGFLWLSTNKGLSKFDTKTGVFKNYDMKDGLQGNEFNQGAYYKNASGEMFFGGNNGFNAFFPEKIIDNPHIPPVKITEFQVFNNPVTPGEKSLLELDISETKQISLHQRHQNVFSFEFAALDYSAPEKNQYAYKMEGFEKEWIYPKSRRFVTYTNLPAGDYVFRVKGSNNNSVWNEEGTSIRIKIIPPFWKTTGFIIFSILLLLAFIFLAYKLRVKQIQAHRKELKILVEQRTRELVHSNEQISRQKNKLAQTLAELKESSERYRVIFDSVKDGLIVIDFNGKIVEANPEAYQSRGYEKDEFMGLYAMQLVHTDRKEQFNDFRRQLEQSGQFFAESTDSRKDGSTFPVEVRGANFIYDGKPHLLAVVRDITERKKAEQMLKNYELIISNSTELMALLDTEYRYLAANNTYVQFYGTNQETILGRTVPEFVGRERFEKRLKPYLDQCLAGEEVLFQEWFNYPAQGRKFMYVMYNPVIESNQNVTGVVVTIKDITELKEKTDQLEQLLHELQQTQSQLIQSAKMATLGDVAAGLVHEINSPIGAINSATDVALRGIKKLIDLIHTSETLESLKSNSKLAQILDALQDNNVVTLSAGKRISKIVQSLKSFASLDKSDFQQVNIHEGIESTLALFERDFVDRIHVIKNFADTPKITCYPGDLNQVYMNLFKNAIEAIEGKGRLTIQTSLEDNHVKIEITDSGTGMTKQQIKDAFNPIFIRKGDRVRAGLGLFTSYNIIQKHHGDIRVESEVSKGTTFTITLPTNLSKE